MIKQLNVVGCEEVSWTSLSSYVERSSGMEEVHFDARLLEILSE